MRKQTTRKTNNKRKKRRFFSSFLLTLTLAGIVLTAGIFLKYNFTEPYGRLADSGKYPQELQEMLQRNPDMYDFVLNYPEKKGRIFADNIGEVTKGEFPLLLQWDERWGYGYYGESTVAVSGCAPTALSIVYAGLTGENTVTPYTIASYAAENGYYIPGSGTDWSLMTEGCRHFGIAGDEIPLSENSIKNALNSGNPIICSMRPGDFTTTGHFIVLIGTEDGKIRVNDPNSTQNSTLWDYDTLSPQIRNLWSFQLL